jgi:hypothetical protein
MSSMHHTGGFIRLHTVSARRRWLTTQRDLEYVPDSVQTRPHTAVKAPAAPLPTGTATAACSPWRAGRPPPYAARRCRHRRTARHRTRVLGGAHGRTPPRTWHPRAMATDDSSAARSKCARLPPTVPRARTRGLWAETSSIACLQAHELPGVHSGGLSVICLRAGISVSTSWPVRGQRAGGHVRPRHGFTLRRARSATRSGSWNATGRAGAACQRPRR